MLAVLGLVSAVTATAQTPQHYESVYSSALLGDWIQNNWGSPVVNLAATAPGRTGNAIEVKITNAWEAFSLGEVKPGWDVQYNYLNEYATLEFDIYPESDSVGFTELVFLLEDGGLADQPTIASLIPGWSGMTNAQRYGNWHHVSISLASLHPTVSRFYRFVLWNFSGSAKPHFRLADIKLGWNDDTSAPAITLGTLALEYDQLTLPFTTSEGTIFRIEYGYGNYNQTLTGDPAGWSTAHSAVLSGLTRGVLLQYRIVAQDHRTDPAATPNQGVFTGTYFITDPPPPTTPTVTITANPAAAHAISPWIYGSNFYQGLTNAPRNLTLNRQGGNRWTAYNWENNASNAGSDWFFHNDDYLGGGNTPAEALRPLVAADRARGNASLITVQLQGYVAADKNGDDVTTIPLATRLATRFKQVVFKKGSTFTTTPATGDGSVFMDEFLWALDRRVTGSSAGGTTTQIYSDPATPTFVNLDNEPELWPSTHAEIQTGAPPVTGYIQQTIALCRAIKDLAPAAKTLGPVHYGFNGILNWQNASGFSSTYWFTDRYLADLKAASDTDGRRLLDAYDFHWYSEAQGDGSRITTLTGATLTAGQIQAIVQSPRSLWDPTYRETSWVADALGGPVRILDRLQQKIDAVWPGTGIALTEYDNGGDNHIAGAIAQADNLGVFGQRGVFAACFWPMSDAPFILAGFKMYRDFDGALGTFGDTSIPTTSSDTSKVAAYVSRDSAHPNRYVIVALNRSNAPQAVAFSGLTLAGTARQYRLSGTQTTPVFVGNATVDLATWLLALAPLSVSTVEILAGPPPDTYAAWRAASFSGSDLTSDAISGPTADPDGAGVSNFQRYAFGLAARGAAAPPTTVQLVPSGGQQYLALTFNRRAVATDLSYVVEGSSDLVNWSPVSTIAPGTPAQVTLQDTVAVSSAPRRFLRIRLPAVP